jgi:transposase
MPGPSSSTTSRTTPSPSATENPSRPAACRAALSPRLRTIRKLAGARHAPGDWIQRAQMIAHSRDGLRTTQIAHQLGCHPQTVRERLHRFNAEGVDGLGDRPGPGRPRRLTETDRGRIIALARSQPPGRLHQGGEGLLPPAQPQAPAHWTLDALAERAQAEGIQVARSQVRRILISERVRWRPTRSWTTSTDPDFAPKERRSSPSTPSRPRRRR